MQARHPKTGKPIRIIKSDSSLWRNQKTLVWLEDVSSGKWDRWDVGVVSSTTATALKDKVQVSIVVCLGDMDVEAAWLHTQPKVSIIAVPRALAMKIGIENLVKLQLRNLICLEEIGDLYPYVPKWDGTVEGAKATLGTMMHYKNNYTNPTVSPRPLWFVTQYYKPEKKAREAEIDECLLKNMLCPYIDKIVLLNEKAIAPPHPKIQEKVIKRRLRYADVIRWIYEEAPADAFIAFANADIYLDETWRALWSLDLENSAMALLRWDMKEGKPSLFGPRADSQDTWVLSAAAVKARTWDWSALDFPFGQGGCDNAIALELFRQKFLVTNPAFTLRTIHVHESQLRTYDKHDIVDKPAYLYIEPTGIHDLQPVTNIPRDALHTVFKPAVFDRRIQGPSSSHRLKTYAVMTSKVTGLTFDVDVPNTYKSDDIPLFKYDNVFVSREGLTFTKNSILIGTTVAAKKAWSSASMSLLAASVPIESALVAPLPNAVANSPELYALNYLGKVFHMRTIMEGDFWTSKALEPVLRLFKPTPSVISRDENRQAWCETALVWNAQDAGSDRVTREEVQALRSNLRIQREAERRIVVVGGDWITEEVVNELEKIMPVTVLWSTTSVELIADALVGAAAFVTHGPLGSWAWMMPAGSILFEIQCEMNPAIDLLHLAGAANLNHQLYVIARGKPTEKQLTQLSVAIAGVCTTDVKPVLKMPSRTGFFGHAGDSFRELATLWSKRGYVTIEPTDSGHVSLVHGSETVLYDRPSYDWLNAEPTAAPMLVGNPVPITASQHPWTFWPRRPTLVEELSSLDLHRVRGLVFYGRSENAVQLSNRTKADWSSVCDEFVHVTGFKPYPFTHEEYLRKLAEAKWGLCLAGYGKKCHREIECMAMGCVPIVAPEVDMESYAVPPVEGVHFFRAADPLTAEALVQGTPDEVWAAMSAACRAWWRDNASVDGSWALTKRLCAHMGSALPSSDSVSR
jgi:hypothetical protein